MTRLRLTPLLAGASVALLVAYAMDAPRWLLAIFIVFAALMLTLFMFADDNYE